MSSVLHNAPCPSNCTKSSALINVRPGSKGTTVGGHGPPEQSDSLASILSGESKIIFTEYSQLVCANHCFAKNSHLSQVSVFFVGIAVPVLVCNRVWNPIILDANILLPSSGFGCPK